MFSNNRCLSIKAYDNWKVQSAIIDRRAHDETEFRKAGTRKPPVIISIISVLGNFLKACEIVLEQIMLLLIISFLLFSADLQV